MSDDLVKQWDEYIEMRDLIRNIDILKADGETYEAPRVQDYTDGTNEVLRGENQRLEATVARLTAQVEAMRGALIAEREENLWNAYNTGIERDGRWSDACMSDAEWLVRECGLDPDFVDHPADVLKALIPEAAKRAALTTEKTNG